MKNCVCNIKFGILLLIIGSFFAFYLGFSIEKNLTDGNYAVPFARIFLRAGHTHGMLIGLYNIVIGLLINQYVDCDKCCKWISITGMGSVLLPIGLVVRGLTGGAMTFAFIPMTGALCFIASLILLFVGIKNSGATCTPDSKS